MPLLTYSAPERNKEPILDVLRRVLPSQGRVLEVASGTGQHIVHFATALPQLTWLPSDPEQVHREAIAARCALASIANVEAPRVLDVRERPWEVGAVAAVVCINMIHIAPWEAAVALTAESARLLPQEGLLFLYGPFKRDGRHSAPSNETFDASLQERDAQWGVRNLEDVQQLSLRNSLELSEVTPMPANNLSVVFRKRSR